MQEHVGKKRKKEIRKAINLKKECNKRLLRSVGLIVVLIIVIMGITALGLLGYFNLGGMGGQVAMFAVAIVGVVIAGNDANKFYDARKAYKETIARYNITKEDMAELKAME